MRSLIAIATVTSAAAGSSCSLSDFDDLTPLEIERVELPALPEPVSNNAVTAVIAGGTEYLISFNGLGPGRTHADVHARTFVFDSEKWRETGPGR